MSTSDGTESRDPEAEGEIMSDGTASPGSDIMSDGTAATGDLQPVASESDDSDDDPAATAAIEEDLRD